MITKYETITAISLKELVGDVNYYLKLGWQPFGAPFQYLTYSDGSGQAFCQVMVSDKEE